VSVLVAAFELHTERTNSASRESCLTSCICHREFPHVETFVKERSNIYPNMKVKYHFGAPPRLNMRSGSSSESIRIDHWKTEHIEEYLKDKLLPAT